MPAYEETVRAILPVRAGAAVLMLALASSIWAQQQPPPPATPPAPQQTPAPTSAPPEIAADDPDNGEPVSAYYWLTGGSGKLRAGVQAAVPADQNLALPGAAARSPGASVSMPAGKFNHLELSYFQADGNGTNTATTPLGLFGGNIPLGQFLSTTYRVRSVQLTWNYLTWPAPPEDSKFRIRTLYGFNYTSVSATIDAPFYSDPNFTAPHGARNIFYPMFGIKAEYIPSKHFYFELRPEGFAFPHRAVLASAEVTVSARIKRLEIFAGYKFFHYKTSPQNDQYFVGSLEGPLGGLRWVLR